MENTCARVFFFIKLQAWGHKYSQVHKNSGTSVFLWILWNFQEHFFHRTPPDGLLIPLKTSENQNFNDVFRGIKRENWGKKSQSKVLK